MRNLYQTFHPDSLGYYLATVVACVLFYVYLAALVRLTGIRTVSRLTSFDLVITVAMGAIFGGSLLTDRLPEGVVTLTVIAILHLATQAAAARIPALSRAIARSPVLLARNGRVFENVLHRERVARAELESAARAAGCASLEDVSAATLEPDGTISIVPRTAEPMVVRTDEVIDVDRIDEHEYEPR